MKKIKIKFILSLILLINSIIVTVFYSEHIDFLERIFIPLFFIYFTLDSLSVLFPAFNSEIYSGKYLYKFYNETNNYNKSLLAISKKHQNRRSLIIFVIYFGILSAIGVFYIRFDFFEIQYLYIIFFLINFGDYFSILVWCPFKSLILQNTCCNRCRIANWDRLMKFYILLFIPSFYSISLVLLGLTIFLIWEYTHFKHPERFYSVSNSSLSCIQCSDTTICKKNKE